MPETIYIDSRFNFLPMTSDKLESIFYFSLGLLGSLWVFWEGFNTLKLKRLVENIPTSKIRSMAMGLVEVYAQAYPYGASLLMSPLSQIKCVYYRYTIEEYKKKGNDNDWVVIDKGSTSIPFIIKDETGSAMVDPKEADFDLSLFFNYKTGFWNGPPETIARFLQKNKIEYTRSFGMHKKMRFTEYLIKPESFIYVLGTAQANTYINGNQETGEWKNIMIKKGLDNKTFCISDKSEQKLTSSLFWRVWGQIVGGAVAAIAFLALILLELGIF